MAVLTIVQQPPRFCSAYKPMTVGVTSLRSPVNQIPGESGIAINTVKVADAADVVTYGAPLEVGDLFVYHATVSLGIWPVGQHIQLIGMDIPAYDGIYRVLKLVTDKVTVIDGEDFGVAITGTISKHYHNYNLIAQVSMQGAAQSIEYALQPNSITGVFELNAQDFAQRSFKDVFKIAEGGQPFALIDAEKYITQEWNVLFQEAYDIPDGQGVNVYTERGKDGEKANLNDMVVVNSVQPYHHINEETGDPDYLWEDDLFPYELIEGPIAQKRFLTYHPPGGLSGFAIGNYRERTAQRVGDEDDLWLSFLWNDETVDRLYLRVISYGADGLQDDLQDIPLLIEKDSYIFNAGPVALAAYLAPTTDHYRISIVNNIGTDLTVPMWITLDEHCIGGTRFYSFNSFGGIDQYTVDGSPEARRTEVKRSIAEKPNMAVTLPVEGDHNRRTFASKVVRHYAATTRTEPKAILRWFCDEVIERPDVRVRIYNGDVPAYTKVIIDNEKVEMNIRAGRIRLGWSLGVDNVTQRR